MMCRWFNVSFNFRCNNVEVVRGIVLKPWVTYHRWNQKKCTKWLENYYDCAFEGVWWAVASREVLLEDLFNNVRRAVFRTYSFSFTSIVLNSVLLVYITNITLMLVLLFIHLVNRKGPWIDWTEQSLYCDIFPNRHKTIRHLPHETQLSDK